MTHRLIPVAGLTTVLTTAGLYSRTLQQDSTAGLGTAGLATAGLYSRTLQQD